MPTDEAINQLRGLGIRHFNEDREAVAIEIFHLYLQFRPDDWEVLRWYARCLLVVGCLREAEAIYLQILSTKNEYSWSEVHAELGQLYDHLGDLETAVKHWEHCCRDENAPGFIWIMRGIALARLGRFDEAIDCQKTATNIDNECDRDEAYLNLGFAFRAQGKYAEAIVAFENALEITPDYSEAIEALKSLENWAESLEQAKNLLGE